MRAKTIHLECPVDLNEQEDRGNLARSFVLALGFSVAVWIGAVAAIGLL